MNRKTDSMTAGHPRERLRVSPTSLAAPAAVNYHPGRPAPIVSLTPPLPREATFHARAPDRRLRLHRQLDRPQPARPRRPGLGLRPEGRSPPAAAHPRPRPTAGGHVPARRRDRPDPPPPGDRPQRSHPRHPPGRPPGADLPG